MTADAEGFRPPPAHYEMCFGCGTEHPADLHLRMEGAERRVRGSFEVTEHHQGAPGLAHGGVLAAAVDEGMGFLLHVLAVPAVTGHLEMDFRKPVPVGSVLELAGEVEDVEGRKIRTRMTGSLGALHPGRPRALHEARHPRAPGLRASLQPVGRYSPRAAPSARGSVPAAQPASTASMAWACPILIS